MNQHQIQEAYLKTVVGSDNKLLVYRKNLDMKPIKVAPLNCTVLKDFQSVEKEEFQNKAIETPGIKALRKLIKNVGEISDGEIAIIFNCLSLL